MSKTPLSEATENAIKLAFTLGVGQSQSEVRDFLSEVVNELKPERTIELGYCNGANTYILSSVTSIITIGIDVNGCYDGRLPAREKIELINGDSHDSASIEKASSLLENKPIDLLFIDADHSYDAVKKDFEIWGKLVRPGGWIAFHDIDPHHVNIEQCGCIQLWNEIKGNKTEFIQPNYYFGGIGLLKT